MKWIQRSNTYLSAPYSVISHIQGWECWYQTAGKYGVLARRISTLEKAKEYCEAHKAREAHLLKDLDAVSVK
jgi:hypothetical protein